THIARGYYEYYGLLHYPQALDEFRAALLVQPSNTNALSGITWIMRRQDRFEEAADEMAKWIELDPQNSFALWNYGWTLQHLHRFAEADRRLGSAMSLNPQFGNPWAFRGWNQILWRGDVEKA